MTSLSPPGSDHAAAPDGGLGPQLLPPNRFEHFYGGGDRIAALRGGPGGPRRPEEWIGSITTRAGEEEQGLSRLPDGTVLLDAILADPRQWLGPSHVEAFGASTELLVKLLDAAQRLPAHLHPPRAFSRRHLGVPHGKTEAWIVLEADEGAAVRVGFAESQRLADVRAMVDADDGERLLAALRSCPVRPGDAVLVPAGLAHSIDAGIFLIELQEPTDLSILLESAGLTIDLRREGHLGLGFDVALQALVLDALDDDEFSRLVLPSEQVAEAPIAALLPPASQPYFRAHRVRAAGADSARNAVEAGFAVALATGGSGRMLTESGQELALSRGAAAVVPWAAGAWRVEGTVEVVACRPPRPSDAEAAQ